MLVKVSKVIHQSNLVKREREWPNKNLDKSLIQSSIIASTAVSGREEGGIMSSLEVVREVVSKADD